MQIVTEVNEFISMNGKIEEVLWINLKGLAVALIIPSFQSWHKYLRIF